MVVRRTEEKDCCQVVSMWQQAREYFKTAGIDQWQDGYPNEESLQEDMADGESYVLAEGDQVLATAFISFQPEPDYDVIYEGEWQLSAPYCVVHRVAVSPDCKGQGLAGKLIAYAVKVSKEKGIHSIRMDTHEDNQSMQRMLQKNGFCYRGIIYLRRDGARRVAFEKLLDE